MTTPYRPPPRLDKIRSRADPPLPKTSFIAPQSQDASPPSGLETITPHNWSARRQVVLIGQGMVKVMLHLGTQGGQRRIVCHWVR